MTDEGFTPAAEPSGDWARMRASERALADMPGRARLLHLNALARTHAILMANGRELDSHLALIDGLPEGLEILDVRHPERLDAYLDAAERLLGNYLASVAMLIEHTRVFIRDSWGTASAFEAGPYSEHTRVFRTDATAVFLHGLRNYQLHYRLPPMLVETNFSQSAMTTTVHLHLKAFHAFEWTPEAQAFVTSADNVPLAPLVHHYAGLVVALYEWLNQAFLVENASEITAFRQAEDQHFRTFPEQTWDDP